MVYRFKTYSVEPARLEDFNEFFHRYLLPNQLRFGSKLIGRWVNSEKTSIMAIWEYEDVDQYNKIEEKIKRTNLHKQAQVRKEDLGSLYLTSNQEFWQMTGDYVNLGGTK
jgi:hypothetical protein